LHLPTKTRLKLSGQLRKKSVAAQQYKSREIMDINQNTTDKLMQKYAGVSNKSPKIKIWSASIAFLWQNLINKLVLSASPKVRCKSAISNVRIIKRLFFSCFFNISQSEKRIILGSHVYRPNGTKWRNFIEDLTIQDGCCFLR
jgi:hypothetical protein